MSFTSRVRVCVCMCACVWYAVCVLHQGSTIKFRSSVGNLCFCVPCLSHIAAVPIGQDYWVETFLERHGSCKPESSFTHKTFRTFYFNLLIREKKSKTKIISCICMFLASKFLDFTILKRMEIGWHWRGLPFVAETFAFSNFYVICHIKN